VSAGEADVCVEGGGEAAQEGDGGLGAAFLDALDTSVLVGEMGLQGLADLVDGGGSWRENMAACRKRGLLSRSRS
jgi:hypothetical protein